MLWGLLLVERGDRWEPAKPSPDAALPRAYALMKLTLLPFRLTWAKSHDGKSVLVPTRPGADGSPAAIVVKPEPTVLAKLRAGDVQGGV